jgi:hypothetical protein
MGCLAGAARRPRLQANSVKIFVLSDPDELLGNRAPRIFVLSELDELLGYMAPRMLEEEPLPVKIARAPVGSDEVALFSAFNARYFVTNC